MTLKETIGLINYVAQKQPNVNGIVKSGDIFDLSKEEYQQRYSAFCCTEDEHEITESWTRFSFILYYVDRLTLNKENKEEIHSNAVNFFENFTAYMIKNFPEVNFEPGTVITFTERFSAECAGAYMRCNVITTPNSLCPVEYNDMEPVTITTYKFKEELEYYDGNWCTTYSSSYSNSAIGQSTLPMEQRTVFNEVCFPLRLTNYGTTTQRNTKCLILKGYPLDPTVTGSSNSFNPAYGWPSFDQPNTNLLNKYRDVVYSGLIDLEAGTYKDFSIKLDKEWTLEVGESLIVFLFGRGYYVYMSGYGTSNNQLPFYDEQCMTGLASVTYSYHLSPFTYTWYRLDFSPTSTRPSRYIVCQPVLKWTYWS